MALNEFLKKSRENQRYTQDEAGKAVGVSTATIQNWENNRSKPDINILSSIASAYHISLDELGRNLISDLKKDEVDDNCEKTDDFPEWFRLFPDFPELNNLKRLQLSKDEQRIFLIIALHSRFNANPLPEIFKYFSDYIYIDNIVARLQNYGLYTVNSSCNIENSNMCPYGLTELGFIILDIIKEKHTDTLNICKLKPKELSDIMCKYDQSGVYLSRYNFIKNLAYNKEIPLNYYDERYIKMNQRYRVVDYGLPQFLTSLGVNHVDYDFCIRNKIKYSVSGYIEWLNIDDFYTIEEEEFEGKEYRAARKLYLQKKEVYDINKELIDGIIEPKEVSKIALRTVRPTKKAIDFMNLLSDNN